jgi:hypothetical protein
MVNTKVTTTQQFNNLIEFRQRVYEEGLVSERDAQFELVETLLTGCKIQSFAELSLSPLHRRQYSSAYMAVQRGRQDVGALRQVFAEQVPRDRVLVTSLDASKWPHRQADTLSGRVLEPYQGQVMAVHVYSKLAWIPEEHTSWALPLSTVRLEPDQTEVQVGAAQVDEVCRRIGDSVLIVVAVDGRYGTHHFMQAMQDVPAAWVVRLARNRVFRQKPGPYVFGRPAKHGPAFRFKDPATWTVPSEDVQFEHPYYGQVRLRRWHGLHDKLAPELPITLVRAEVHLERAKPPDPLWLGYNGPAEVSVRAIWEWYMKRWPIEPAFRFRKQRLFWTVPRFRSPERCDRWTMLVDIAYWQIWLARHLVTDRPLPWQHLQPRRLTPERIQQGCPPLLAILPALSRPVQCRGKSSGWPRGQPRAPRLRFPAVKRTNAAS